jgi:tetratricopeptide (TPR) repeat protein
MRQRISLAAAILGLSLSGLRSPLAAQDNPTLRRASQAYNNLSFAQAITLVRQASRERLGSDDQARAYELLGFSYASLDSTRQATEAFKQALLLNPNQPGSYERMAEIFASQLKKPEKAIEVLNEARRRFPDLPGFAYLLARTLSMAKRHTEALAAFDMTRLEAEQNQESLLNGGFYFEWGAAAEQAGEYEKSVELFRKCLKIEDRPEVIAQASNYLGYMWVDRNENLEEARPGVDCLTRPLVDGIAHQIGGASCDRFSGAGGQTVPFQIACERKFIRCLRWQASHCLKGLSERTV